YFGPIPPGDEPPPVLAEEPPQRGERRVQVPFDAEPELLMGWRVPSASHQDAPALNVLARLLAGGKTSRLYRRLVLEDRLTTSVSASTGPALRGPGILTVAAQPMGDHTAAEVEAAILEEVGRIRDESPSPRELERVRNQLEGADVRRLGSNMGLAFQLVDSVIYHDDWRETFRSGQRLAAVTAEDVRRVAAEYLVPERMTVAELVTETAP
ncbi:MAG TPA: insulinase family protein, partial [Longimicrobiales bacterium]|nr:insulinase family protein [Longimicrobiales bacterium]